MQNASRSILKSWYVTDLVLVILLFGGLPRGAQADLIVSDFNGGGTQGQIRKFDNLGNPIPPVPFINSIGGGGEGLACLKLVGVPELFVANNGSTINVYDPVTGAFLRTFVTGLGQVAALSLSPDGSLLYAADFGSQRLIAFYTTGPNAGTVAYSALTPASHDVRVGPDGSVYAADFRFTGVVKFDSTLTNSSTYIADGDHGLTSPAGMAFDRTGNLWVSNFTGNHTNSAVYEYDTSGIAGTFLRNISNPTFGPDTDILYEPFGLDLGPDGNIYVAVFGNDSVAEINLANNYSLGTFIPNAGFEPKYVAFTENCCNIPEPASIALVGSGMFAMLGIRRKSKRTAGLISEHRLHVYRKDINSSGVE